MPIWIALIVAPLLALADQALAFAVVGWACAHQNALAQHAGHLLFLIGALLATAMAWRDWRATAASADAVAAQRHFLAGVATTVAALSAAAIAAMWIAAWMIASCIA